MGSGRLLESIAAIVIGGTALTVGVGDPHRTIPGATDVAVPGTGTSLSGIDPFGR